MKARPSPKGALAELSGEHSDGSQVSSLVGRPVASLRAEKWGRRAMRPGNRQAWVWGGGGVLNKSGLCSKYAEDTH